MQNHFYSQSKTKSASRLDQDRLKLPEEHDIYSEKKHYFPHYFEDQQQNGTPIQ